MHLTRRAPLKMGVILILTLTTSCATQALWKATDPAEYVSVRQDEVSESELQQKGVNYRKDDILGVYYLEKTSLRRFGDYAIRAFAVPATVVIDAATVIAVVGAISYVEGCRNGCEYPR